MLRALALTMFLALAIAVPTALADPIAAVGLAPGARVVNDTSGPYYLFATASQPDAPRPAKSSDDCAAGQAALPPDGALLKLIRGMPLPTQNAGVPHTVAPYVPTCFATEAKVETLGTTNTLPPVGADVRASYNVSDGRYYVDPDLEAGIPGIPIVPPTGFSMSSKALTGTTGVGLMADCEECPQPP